MTALPLRAPWRFVSITLATFALVAAAPAQTQQTYPNRPIRFIVPSATGGSNDIAARLFGQKMAEGFGKQVVIDNRVGAGSIIGTELVAKSSPDGYTLLLQSTELTIIASLFKKLPFDVTKDLAPVTLLASFPLLLVVHPSLEAKSLQELIALARAKPGQINFASNGNGTISHIAAESFKTMAGINLVHVPYKGAAPALTALLAGETSVGFYTVSSTLQNVKAGRLRALATSGEKRVPSLSNLPTFAEAGLPGFDARTWAGVFVRAGTPRPIIAKLHAEFIRIMRLPDIQERFVAFDWEPAGNAPEEFAMLIQKEMAKWAKVIRDAQIKAD